MKLDKLQKETINLQFLEAISYEDLPNVKYYLSQGADINYGNGIPLEIACRKGFTKIVKFLLDNGANVNANNDEAIIATATSDTGTLNKKILELLLEAGADPNAGNGFVLSYLISYDDIKVIKLLIKHGVDVKIKNNDALYRAQRYKSKDIMELLIDNGAYPEIEFDIPLELQEKVLKNNPKSIQYIKNIDKDLEKKYSYGKLLSKF